VPKHQRIVWAAAGIVTILGLAATAFLVGAAGLELISWIAGALSFVVAALTLYLSASRAKQQSDATATPPAEPAVEGQNHFHGTFNGPVQGSGVQHNYLRGEDK
jgi:hypothetical protein